MWNTGTKFKVKPHFCLRAYVCEQNERYIVDMIWRWIIHGTARHCIINVILSSHALCLYLTNELIKI